MQRRPPGTLSHVPASLPTRIGPPTGAPKAPGTHFRRLLERFSDEKQGEF